MIVPKVWMERVRAVLADLPALSDLSHAIGFESGQMGPGEGSVEVANATKEADKILTRAKELQDEVDLLLEVNR